MYGRIMLLAALDQYSDTTPGVGIDPGQGQYAQPRHNSTRYSAVYSAACTHARMHASACACFHTSTHAQGHALQIMYARAVALVNACACGLMRACVCACSCAHAQDFMPGSTCMPAACVHVHDGVPVCMCACLHTDMLACMCVCAYMRTRWDCRARCAGCDAIATQ